MMAAKESNSLFLNNVVKNLILSNMSTFADIATRLQ